MIFTTARGSQISHLLGTGCECLSFNQQQWRRQQLAESQVSPGHINGSQRRGRRKSWRTTQYFQESFKICQRKEGGKDARHRHGRLHHLLAAVLPHKCHIGNLHGLHCESRSRLPGRETSNFKKTINIITYRFQGRGVAWVDQFEYEPRDIRLLLQRLQKVCGESKVTFIAIR